MAIWTLARKDLRVLVRDTRAAIILLTMPLLFILVLGVALGESFGQKPDDRLRISVVDEDAGLPPDPGPYPGRKWSEVVRDDLAQTGGIKVEVIPTRQEAEQLVRRGKRSAILVFTPEFSRRVHQCSFLDDKFTGGQPAINPFFRDGIDVKILGLEVLEDPKQILAASIIKQVAQVSLLRVVMPWMIGRAFDKIGDKQFIDEMAERVEVSAPFGRSKFKPLKALNERQRLEVGVGVQESLQEIFRKYDLRAKNWASLTRSEPAKPEEGALTMYQSEAGFQLSRGAVRYQILVPAATVMFAFFLVLNVGWLFVGERRQGTLLRLRAAPLSRAEILLGKLLPCYFISVGQGVFLLAAGRIIFGMTWGPFPAMLPLVVAATSLAAVGLAVLVASVARTESQVSIYGSLLVLVLGVVSGCLMPRDQMPEQVQQVSWLIPHAWALDAYQELLVPNPDLVNVLIDCGILSLFGLGFTALAWLLMRLD
ncbi:MAG: ABC transporter permease [Gemmataceae bacterium]|nr:ABC transporter permease [Gemmataceae bacterium]